MRLDAALNLFIGDWKISLDGNGSKDCFVSHAHSDHTSALKAKNKNIIASEITLALANYNGNANFNGNGKIKLLNSGHILGSTQFFAEHDGETLTYTGDFKMQDSLTTKKAEIRECDSLIVESTYASPEVTFPDRETVYSQIADWVKRNFENGLIVLLGGYSIGKAQELIKIMNEYLGVAPIVETRIENASKVYEKFGVSLERVPVMTDEANELMKRNYIGIGICSLGKLQIFYATNILNARSLENNGKVRALVIKGDNVIHIELICPKCGNYNYFSQEWKPVSKAAKIRFTIKCPKCGNTVKVEKLKGKK